MLKPWQFYVSLTVGGLCLVLALLLVGTNRGNQRLQEQLQAQQIEIDRGQASQQLGQNLLRDLGNAALNNLNIRQLLQRYGYQVVANPPPAEASRANTTAK